MATSPDRVDRSIVQETIHSTIDTCQCRNAMVLHLTGRTQQAHAFVQGCHAGVILQHIEINHCLELSVNGKQGQQSCHLNSIVHHKFLHTLNYAVGHQCSKVHWMSII